MNRRSFLGKAAAVAGGAATLGAARALAQAGGSDAQGRDEVIRLSTVSANYRDGLEQLGREYEELHPGVTVKVEVLPLQGYETWLRAQIAAGGAAGGGAPDLFNANYAWGFYERGLLENLTPFIDRPNPYTRKPWRATLSEQFLERQKIGGDIAIIPMDFVEVGFYYNKDVFDRLQLGPPRTWQEMLQHAQRIRSADIIPFAVPGNADSYWSGTVGWIARFISDAYSRDLVPLVMARPGDWDYRADRNAGFRLDLTDPYNDALLVINGERNLEAVREGKIRFDGPRFRAIYTHIKEFSRYWQRGFHGADAQTAYHLFLSGKAAMLLETSGQITELMNDLEDLPPAARFRWDIFAPPPIAGAKIPGTDYPLPGFRGVGGPGVMWAVVKKNEQQTQRVVDFLMFLTTPHAAQVLVEQALANKRSLTGPMLIPGATIPDRVSHYFKPFMGRGFEKLSYRGLADEQQSIWEWTVWAQRYMEDLISIDDFLERYQRLMIAAVPRVIDMQDLDMNPRTKDMNA